MRRNLSKCINQLDPEATATVSLQGLMLSHFNRNGEFWTRVISCPDHSLRIDITRVPRVSSGMSVNSPSLPIEINKSIKKISIREMEPERGQPSSGVLTYKNFSVPFTRIPSAGSKPDFNDFRWIVDLNSGEFHDRRLEFERNPSRPQSDSRLSPIITVNAGTVYAQAVSSEILFTRDEEGRHRKLGRIAYRTGIDIKSSSLCVTITDECGDREYEWSRCEDYFYFIQVTNSCQLKPVPGEPERTAGRSDFDLFYDHLMDPVINHRSYDLQECVGDEDAPRPQMDGFPDICILGYLGGDY